MKFQIIITFSNKIKTGEATYHKIRLIWLDKYKLNTKCNIICGKKLIKHTFYNGEPALATRNY